MLKKNDRLTIDITDYTDEGLGVGKVMTAEGTFALFVKDTAAGDRAEVIVTRLNKSYGYGKLIRVLRSSPDRVDPECPVASCCGGCTLRHISYDAQLKWKQKRVSDCMERIGGLTAGKDYEYMSVLGMKDPGRYRNKAQYPVGVKFGRVVTGFYAGRTHSVVASEDCLIEPEGFGDILKIIREYAQAQDIPVYDEETGRGIIRHVLLREGMGGGEVMVCIIVNADAGDKSLSRFKGLSRIMGDIPAVKTFLLSHNTAKTNVILGKDETIFFGEGRIRDRIGENVYEISAKSFYQVNPAQTKVLYETAAEMAGLTGQEVVWDLYCGTGTIALFLAGRAKKVYGVEVVDAAVKDAEMNALLNGIKNAEFYCGKAEDIGCGISLPPPDVVVVDPPRKGCDARLIDTVAGSGAGRIVYVSCNPATLARDAKLLGERGYRIRKLQPVDMFPHTTGVENVAIFTDTFAKR